MNGVLRPEGDRRSVRFERTFDVPPDELWRLVTEPDALRRWLAPAGAVLEPRVGGRFELQMAEDGTGAVHGFVRAFEPPRLLEVDWHYEGESESILRLEVTPRSGGTFLVLDHRLLQESQAAGYAAGWHAYLDALEDVPRGGHGSWDERFGARLAAYRSALAELSR